MRGGGLDLIVPTAYLPPATRAPGMRCRAWTTGSTTGHATSPRSNASPTSSVGRGDHPTSIANSSTSSSSPKETSENKKKKFDPRRPVALCKITYTVVQSTEGTWWIWFGSGPAAPRWELPQLTRQPGLKRPRPQEGGQPV